MPKHAVLEQPQQAAMEQARPSTLLIAAPQVLVRLVGALLALAVAAVHVADQGGLTAFQSPAWLGWAFRLVEVGGVLTAVVLLVPWAAWLGWAAGVLLGLGPFTGYIASRSVGLPGDRADVGRWGDWVGTASLVLEAAVVMLSLSMLLAWRQRHFDRRPARSPSIHQA